MMSGYTRDHRMLLVVEQLEAVPRSGGEPPPDLDVVHLGRPVAGHMHL